MHEKRRGKKKPISAMKLPEDKKKTVKTSDETHGGMEGRWYSTSEAKGV